MKDVQWQKNLYENYGLPDNYTDSSFLEQLRKNIKPNNVTIIEAISLGASISTKLSVVVLFVMVFIWLNNEWTTPNVIVISGSMLMILGYFTYNMKIPDRSVKSTMDLWTVLIFLTFGYILSPILKALTETISTDIIYAMTILMLLIHLIFSKYESSHIFLSDSLSITSSIFGSLMLASRLASPLHAFSLLTVSVQCFVLLPYLLLQINNQIIISTVLTICIIYLLLFVSQIFSYVFIIAVIFIHFICPLWYIRCQKYKDNIYGPWDEAVMAS
ncbi:Phosphatidylinositol N-acetylglucosaminyltransferase subunit C [Cyphomyrmex costatus]|uniref:Phosphatidylinositol N-acetylglucosaminyltransferase subunit C n=1 Tax=Cyphomyrmex costatus TaxID=456900 RepID=A0A195CN67_9HYME|nr:Phosphatidylinositol N-acetylglucosaminyltransferase subunit C [Cyphomyrmex costatus]